MNNVLTFQQLCSTLAEEENYMHKYMVLNAKICIWHNSKKQVKKGYVNGMHTLAFILFNSLSPIV